MKEGEQMKKENNDGLQKLDRIMIKCTKKNKRMQTIKRICIKIILM